MKRVPVKSKYVGHRNDWWEVLEVWREPPKSNPVCKARCRKCGSVLTRSLRTVLVTTCCQRCWLETVQKQHCQRLAVQSLQQHLGEVLDPCVVVDIQPHGQSARLVLQCLVCGQRFTHPYPPSRILQRKMQRCWACGRLASWRHVTVRDLRKRLGVTTPHIWTEEQRRSHPATAEIIAERRALLESLQASARAAKA